MPVVRTVGWLLGRCAVKWLPIFLGWVDLLSYGAPHARASRARGAPLLQPQFGPFKNCYRKYFDTDCQESIATVKISLDWSRMVYSLTWSSDLFLILGCISSKFSYLSFSTLPSSLWRTDSIFFAKLDKPSPLSHKPHVFIKLSASQMSCPEVLKGNLENRLWTSSEVTTGH